MNIHRAIKAGTALAVALDAGDANPRAVIGGNHALGRCIDTARGVYLTLANFLKETPVIQSPDDAKKGANLVEQARATLGEMDDERKGLVKPLNDEVDNINGRYRLPRESVRAIVDELKKRLTAFAQAEEAERARVAEEARLDAIEAERLAREAAEYAEQTKEDAECGECANVPGALADYQRAFADYQRAGRTAARAERETTVRLSGGFGRAVSMRKAETLILDDAAAAIAAMGLTDSIRNAILSSARAYRKLRGSLPTGVSSITERQF